MSVWGSAHWTGKTRAKTRFGSEVTCGVRHTEHVHCSAQGCGMLRAREGTEMGTLISLTIRAVDEKNGMTLDELGAFVQKAMSQDLPGETRIKADTGLRQQVKSLSTQ